MTLLTERGINLHLMPIINRNNKDNSKNYEQKRFGTTIYKVEEGSEWTYDCYRLMDYFSTKVREKFNYDCAAYLGRYIKDLNDDWLHENLPFYNDAENKISSYEKILTSGGDPESFLSGSSKYSASADVLLNDMLQHPCLNHLNVTTLDRVIKMASNYKLSCNWAILSKIDNKFKYSHKYNNHGNAQNLFDIEKLEGTTSKDGRVFNRGYKFKFNSMLSAMFLHNIYAGGYSLIEEPFYSLSKNTNMFYRLNFLCYPNKTTTVDSIKSMNRLGSTAKSKSELNKRFKLIIEELNDNNLINILNTQKNNESGSFEYKVSNFMLLN